jgi:hypothetical protein
MAVQRQGFSIGKHPICTQRRNEICLRGSQ